MYRFTRQKNDRGNIGCFEILSVSVHKVAGKKKWCFKVQRGKIGDWTMKDYHTN